MADALRTPEERFEFLPDFPFAAHYREWEGMRLAHVDEGHGPPVVFFHGEPTWSFLWRKVIPPVRDAGFRCLAPDLPGFGRSDKPRDLDWYSYDRHTGAAASLLRDLDVGGATVVVHDWGGPIGLRLAVEHADRIDRMVLTDTGFFTGEQKMSDAWWAFRDFVERTDDLPVSMLVRRACHTDPGDDVAAAYDAPYPDASYKAGPRAFPLMLPTKPDDPGAAEGRTVRQALSEDDRPMLLLWADSDPVLPPETGRAVAKALGREEPRTISGAGHFLQEDAGPEIGQAIADWLLSSPSSSSR
jgi:haloalkane dehalogenase